MAWPTRVPGSIEELKEILHEDGERPDCAFRGEATSRASMLMPTLDRLLMQRDGQQKLALETATIEQFRRVAPMFLETYEQDSLRTVLGAVQLLRHYGGPTRLLDWTTSPWVAAYFVCRWDQETAEIDGVIWRFSLNERRRSARADERHEAIEDARTLTDWVKIFADPPDDLHVVYADHPNPRVVAQQGVFTLSERLGVAHDDLLARQLEPGRYERLLVPAAMKRPMMQALANMNVTATSLFPGADGVARTITDSLVSGRMPIDAKVLRQLKLRPPLQ